MASKSNKFDQAVARARGEQTTAIARDDEPTSLNAIGAAEVNALIRPASVTSLTERIKAGQIEAAERILELEEGIEIVGLLYDRGTTQLPSLKTPNEMDTVNTYKLELYNPETLEASGVRVSIVGSAQLDRDLPPRMGKVVVVSVGGKTRSKRGREFREFFVGTVKEASAS